MEQNFDLTQIKDAITNALNDEKIITAEKRERHNDLVTGGYYYRALRELPLAKQYQILYGECKFYTFRGTFMKYDNKKFPINAGDYKSRSEGGLQKFHGVELDTVIDGMICINSRIGTSHPTIGAFHFIPVCMKEAGDKMLEKLKSESSKYNKNYTYTFEFFDVVGAFPHNGHIPHWAIQETISNCFGKKVVNVYLFSLGGGKPICAIEPDSYSVQDGHLKLGLAPELTYKGKMHIENAEIKPFSFNTASPDDLIQEPSAFNHFHHKGWKKQHAKDSLKLHFNENKLVMVGN